MKRYISLLLSLVMTMSCITLTGCYKYDPIRDKMNRVGDSNKPAPQPNPNPDPKPQPGEEEGEWLYIAGQTKTEKVPRETNQKITITLGNKNEKGSYNRKLYLVTSLQGKDMTNFVGSSLKEIPANGKTEVEFNCNFSNVEDGDYYLLVAYTTRTGQVVTINETAGKLLVGNARREQHNYLFSFEVWDKRTPTDQYELPVAEDPFSPTFWTSASNIGYSLMPGRVIPYPVNKAENGFKGACASIQTRPGKKTAGMGKYLVAGSLYSGQAEVSKFLAHPLESSLFGQLIDEIPVKLSGYYKYKPGPKYINGETNTELPGKKDQGTIAVVFYEAPNVDFFLNGTNLYTDPHIIAYKQFFVDATPGDDWIPFEFKIPVTNKELYNNLDFIGKKYKIAIVFASSRRGDQFLGSVESTLYIDEITLTTEK